MEEIIKLKAGKPAFFIGFKKVLTNIFLCDTITC
jgi:hypothetical protein